MRCVVLSVALAVAASLSANIQTQAQQPAAPIAPAAGSAPAGAPAAAAPAKVTYDKSLGPDGKPWSGVSVIKYLKDKLPDLKFTIVKRLEMSPSDLKGLLARNASPAQQVDPADKKIDRKEAAKLRRQRELAKRNTKPAAGSSKKEKNLTYSETPARTALIDQISEQFNVQPDRAILDFCGSRKEAYALPSKKHFEDGRPEDHAEDIETQDVYWILAVEVIDFRGNENAAEAYEKGFAENIKLHCYRWHSVVFTGGSAMWLSSLLHFGEFSIPVNGKWKTWKVEPYQGFPVASQP